MLEPISRGLFARRMKRLRARIDWLDSKVRESKPESIGFLIAERDALLWAVDELVAIYAEHDRNRPQRKTP